MVHTPFGYEIRDGKPEVCLEEREKLEYFFRAYLEGMTIQEAGAAARIPLSRPTLGRMLQNRVYLGNEYYPALLEEVLFLKVEKERQRRYEGQGNFGKRKPRGTSPVGKQFRMEKPEKNYKKAEVQAFYLYSLIEGDEN